MKKRTVTVIDYNAGNLKSILNMLEYLDCPYIVTSEAEDILNAERIIFPGQGHFAQAMQNLQSRGLIEPIKQVIEKGIPFLGICIGLQILFEESEEAPQVKGMGILKGKVKKFTKGKVPQIGWNKVETNLNDLFLTNNYFYFVNSYYVEPDENAVIAAKTVYYDNFCSAIQKENLYAVQFHPEKSSDAGLDFFRNWLNKT